MTGNTASIEEMCRLLVQQLGEDMVLTDAGAVAPTAVTGTEMWRARLLR